MVKCLVCSANHPLKYCLKFRKMLFAERYDTVVALGCCLNCFHSSHDRAHCPSSNRCQTCRRRHHTMIHRDISEVGSVSFEEEEPTLSSPENALKKKVLNQEAAHQTLFPTHDDVRDLDVQDVLIKFGEINFRDIIDRKQAPDAASGVNKDIVMAIGRPSHLVSEPTSTPLQCPSTNNEALLALGSIPVLSSSTEGTKKDVLLAPGRTMTTKQWAVTDPTPQQRYISPYVYPVVLCELWVGDKGLTVTFMINPRVPMSHVLFDRVAKLPYSTKYKKDMAYGHFKIHTRTKRVLDHWMVIVDELQVSPKPVTHPGIFAWVKDKTKLAHPEPYKHQPIDGVIGADLWDRTKYDEFTSCHKCPSLHLQESAFGAVVEGSFGRFHRSGP